MDLINSSNISPSQAKQATHCDDQTRFMALSEANT